MATSGDASAASIFQPPRKRHRVACRLCHLRKVRCDVSLLGAPCTNCRLDEHVCVQRDPPDRRPKKAISAGAARARAGTAMSMSQSTDIAASMANNQIPQATSPVALSFGDDLMSAPSPKGSLMGDTSGYSFKLNFVDDSDASVFPFSSKLPASIDGFQPFQGISLLNNCVIFSYYNFFRPNELSTLPPEDVRFLEFKGSLHVFSMPILEKMLRQYFVYVHPCMPILNEGDVYSLLRRKRNNKTTSSTRISLLVFQAVIFAASAFAPSDVIRACGFQSRHEARGTLYKRAKLLFDLGVEVDPTSIAQAALLLSFQISANEGHANTSLLVTAIHHARMARAHQYATLPGLDDDQRREKKLLWWSCLVRDRVMALGVRRHIQLTPDLFQGLDDMPTQQDLACDYSGSQVYDVQTKRMLATVFISQCQLAATLTPTLMLVYPPSEAPHPVASSELEKAKVYDRIEECKMSLRLWFETNNVQLRGDESSATGNAAHNNTVVSLHRNLTYIYYYTSRIALCHHALSVLHMNGPSMVNGAQQLNLVITELESAMMGVIQRITNLVNLGISRYIPISMGAYYVLPLVLLLVDVQLPSDLGTKNTRQSHLRACMEAFDHYCQIFDFGDTLSDAMTRTLGFEGFAYLSAHPRKNRNFDPPEKNNMGASSAYTSWVDFLRRDPATYLRISLSLDYTLSKGKFLETEAPKLITQPTPPPAVVQDECGLTDFVNQSAISNVDGMERGMFLQDTGLDQLGFADPEGSDWTTGEVQSQGVGSEDNMMCQHDDFGIASNATETDFWEPRM